MISTTASVPDSPRLVEVTRRWIFRCDGHRCPCMRYRPWEQRYPGYHVGAELNIPFADLVEALRHKGLLPQASEEALRGADS
jgi:hypothetical protein